MPARSLGANLLIGIRGTLSVPGDVMSRARASGIDIGDDDALLGWIATKAEEGDAAARAILLAPSRVRHFECEYWEALRLDSQAHPGEPEPAQGHSPELGS